MEQNLRSHISFFSYFDDISIGHNIRLFVSLLLGILRLEVWSDLDYFFLDLPDYFHISVSTEPISFSSKENGEIVIYMGSCQLYFRSGVIEEVSIDYGNDLGEMGANVY